MTKQPKLRKSAQSGCASTQRHPLLEAYTLTVAAGLNWTLWLAILLSVIFFASFSRPFYVWNYSDLQTAQTIGISERDLNAATELLLDYLEDKRSDLDLQVGWSDGVREIVQVQMFNAREIAHMVDVKALYQKTLVLRDLALGLALLFALALALLARRLGRLGLRRCLLRGLGLAATVFVCLLMAVALYAALDFERFWTSFHLLFFDNDLWLLDPSRDRLIMMVPALFFERLVRRILLSAFASLVAYTALYLGFCRLLGVGALGKNSALSAIGENEGER